MFKVTESTLIIIFCVLTVSSLVFAEGEQTVTPTNTSESWYAIIGKLAGSKEVKMGYEVVTIELLDTQSASQSKQYKVKTEMELKKQMISEAAGTRIIGEILFETQAPGAGQKGRMKLIKSEVRATMPSIKEVIVKYKAVSEGEKMRISVFNDLPGKEFENNPEEPYITGQEIGIYLVSQGIEVNQSYPIKLLDISNYCVSALLIVKEKILPGSEKEQLKYRCNLIVSSPTALYKEIEYIIDANGIVLEEHIVLNNQLGEITLLKTTKEDALIEERPVFGKKGRDDPFKQKVTKTKKGGPPPLPPPVPQVDQVEKLLKEAEEKLEQMKKIYEQVPEEERGDAMSVPYGRILDIYTAVMNIGSQAAKNQMMIIRDDAERLFSGVASVVYQQAVSLRDECKKLFDMKTYEGIDSKLSQIKLLRQKRELEDTEYAAKIDDLIKEVEVILARIATIHEFLRNPPKITGIVYYLKAQENTLPSVKASFMGNQISLPVVYVEYVPSSSAIINNVAYSEGAKLNSDTLIKSISSNEVVFLYRGEILTVEIAGKK
ncbi:MAG: hypothetical protein WC980_08745 [Candidatus Brocadiia bacterium]